MTLSTSARDTISAVGKAAVKTVGSIGGIAPVSKGATIGQVSGGAVIVQIPKGRLSAFAGELSYADLIRAETTRAEAAEGGIQDQIDGLGVSVGAVEQQAQADLAAAQAAIDQALADEAAARAAADTLETQARQDLSATISAALAQATADIQAAQDAAAAALATAEADITQARADASAALAAAQADLQTAIDAVQASSDGVAASLTTETNERIAGDSAEVTARTTAIAGVQSDIGIVAADLTNEQQVRATNDAAEVSAREAAVAGVQDGLDTVTAGLANEESARATGDAAETSARQSAVAAVQDGVDQVSADLTAELQTRATNDAAETSARQTAISGVQDQIATTNAALTGEATTRAANDLAETQARQTAVSQVQQGVDTVNAALTAEEGTRATNDTAETNARTAAVSDLQGQIATTNAALTNEATTRAADDLAETQARQTAVAQVQGNVDQVNAALTAEEGTRATNDTAETNARTAAVSDLQGQVNATNGALTNEATTRAADDAAEASTRSTAVAGLQDGLNSANAAISNEESARTSAVAAEATARLSLSTTLSAAFGPIKTWTQSTAPTFDQMFPVGVQSCPVANLTGTAGIGKWTNTGRTQDNPWLDSGSWAPTGERSVATLLHGTFAPDATYECFDLNGYGQFHGVVPGATYEVSAYTGAHRCRVFIGIDFMDANGQWCGGTHSSSYLGGAPGENRAEKSGGNSLSDFKRLWCRCVAPANAVYAYIYTRGDNSGFGGQSDPYQFITRPMFARVRADIPGPIDWQPFQRPIWYNSSDSNKPYVWNGINSVGFEAKPDARIDTNTTNISQLFSTTNGYAAMWGVQIDTNGKVVGRVQLNGQNGTSSFDVLATSFTVSMPGYSSPIFEVGNVNGSPKIVMRADVFQDDSVGTSAISPNAITRDAISTGANCDSGSVGVTFKANARTIYLTGIYAGNDVLAGGGAAQINIIVNGSTYYYQGVPRVPFGSSYYGATIVTIAYPVPATDTSATIQCTVTGISGGLGRCTIMMDTRLK